MLSNGASHFVHITQSATFYILEIWFLLSFPKAFLKYFTDF